MVSNLSHLSLLVIQKKIVTQCCCFSLSQGCGCSLGEIEKKLAEQKRENEKKELCDGCPCIGLCKPECGLYSYEYNERQCKQCGCRESEDKESELCNGCPCIGVCRSDCGAFPYEYNNLICQQCGCRYQDTMLFTESNTEISLIDQVLHILKSLGVIFYKPGKPIKPLKTQKPTNAVNASRSFV
jgi:hypothetical protein